MPSRRIVLLALGLAGVLLGSGGCLGFDAGGARDVRESTASPATAGAFDPDRDLFELN
jgi:hypothetical protein